MLLKLQRGKSVVLMDEVPHKLRHSGVVRCLGVISKTLSKDAGNIEYAENEDFVVDPLEGTIRRTRNSAIPDWANHVLYGKSKFNHRDYGDCSNRLYTVFVDYEYDQMENEQVVKSSSLQADPLSRVMAKLLNKEKVRYLVFGDSISAGGDASQEEFVFYNLFASELRRLFAGAELKVVNKAIGGENSSDALSRLKDDIIEMEPDLISIGYGMNDQCTMSEEIRNGIPPGLFEQNIRHMVIHIQKATDADIILITPCISNPLWVHSSGDLAIYADILKRIGTESGVAVADVHDLWMKELQSGKTHESLLLNNINHPNDYGHQIYYEALASLIPQAAKEET